MEGLLKSAVGFHRLPILRQLGLLVGLSASIALGFAIVLWSKEPNYRPLFSHLNPKDTTEILDSLQQSGIEYKLDQNTGTVLVPADKVYDARFKIAGEGLSHGSNSGFELLDQNSGLGTSRFMETARYKRALEGELSRTIASLKNVRSARIHLALPKDSIFVNDKQKASASVFLDVAQSNSLTKMQVTAIQQLVAASVPNLSAGEVSVVDQTGQLLSSGKGNESTEISNHHLHYTNQLEKDFENHIINVLSPLVGHGNIKASVSADMDFTRVERTEEDFIPNSGTIRSEHVVVDDNDPPLKAAGVPGALVNKAPQNEGGEKTNDVPIKTKQATRNFEVGKRISHAKNQVGVLKRLSIAVVVDNLTKVDEASGKSESTPLTKEQIDNITNLVKNSVGFNPERGDQVSVVNIPFMKAEIEPVVETPIWKQAWVIDLAKNVAGGLFVLLLVFLVLKPILKMLANKESLPKEGQLLPQDVNQLQLEQGQGAGGQPDVADWSSIQQVADDDPKKIAQVMKTWVGDDK